LQRCLASHLFFELFESNLWRYSTPRKIRSTSLSASIEQLQWPGLESNLRNASVRRLVCVPVGVSVGAPVNAEFKMSSSPGVRLVLDPNPIFGVTVSLTLAKRPSANRIHGESNSRQRNKLSVNRIHGIPVGFLSMYLTVYQQTVVIFMFTSCARNYAYSTNYTVNIRCRIYGIYGSDEYDRTDQIYE